MKRAAVVAGCGKNVGLGHIMRTMVLADALKSALAMEITYILPDNGCSKENELIHEKGFATCLLSQQDIDSAAWEWSFDLTILDSYRIDEAFINRCKAKSRCVFCFDDNKLLENYNADFVFNQNAGAEQLPYIADAGTKLLLGAQYVLLRKEFTTPPPVHINEGVQNILITMGGADVKWTTDKLLAFMENSQYNFHVVIGPNAENKQALTQMALKNKKIRLYQNVSMGPLMCRCDLAVTACGSTMYELASLGVPMIGIITADNQIRAGKAMAEAGTLLMAGYEHSLEKHSFLSLLAGLAASPARRKAMQQAQFKTVGKDGAAKVCEEIKEFFSRLDT